MVAPTLRDGSCIVLLGYASITKVNTLLPLPNPRTHSSSFPLQDSLIFRAHSARLFRLPRLAEGADRGESSEGR
jgi:hypothetical protein